MSLCVCVSMRVCVCVCGSLLQYYNISLVQLTSTLHVYRFTNAFKSPVGPTVFTDDQLRKVVQQSNHFARQVMGDLQYHSWKQVSVHELKAFLGFSVLMGINHLPSITCTLWTMMILLHVEIPVMID